MTIFDRGALQNKKRQNVSSLKKTSCERPAIFISPAFLFIFFFIAWWLSKIEQSKHSRRGPAVLYICKAFFFYLPVRFRQCLESAQGIHNVIECSRISWEPPFFSFLRFASHMLAYTWWAIWKKSYHYSLYSLNPVRATYRQCFQTTNETVLKLKIIQIVKFSPFRLFFNFE